ncbi:hypothetical protein BDY17DRAFT_305180 [Neohortaea acidophila]|uniref:Uncharacterized protein n=1 Tax=Neohortaea acidophila TaxID=245834 RepID=A0A6A6PHL4_9PEZI|nr:uncharacterized protein BDY17DRAFT_305180 [Neohortaea acidophila]KAF2479214.1 hypothetical protein BDY17DRAFT_305180 [Neohortaea acidophila]
MDPERESSVPTDDYEHDGQAEAEGGFSATWQATDAALLQPGNLHIAKVQRGWDRKPLSPFSRDRLRVGKVWKRTTPATSSNLSTHAASPPGVARASKCSRSRASLTAPLKPVKKVCLDSDFGMLPQVLQWEAIESPVRKIVTRSRNTSEGDMLALPDEAEEEDVPSEDEGNITVEILDEDGTVLEIGGQELGNEEEWEDEEELHQGDADELICPTAITLPNEEPSVTSDVANLEPTEGDEHGTDTAQTELLLSQSPAPELQETDPVHPQPRAQDFVLPEGFVSPAKRLVSKPRAKRSFDSRRRTLPAHFVPLTIAKMTVDDQDENTQQSESSSGTLAMTNVESPSASQTKADTESLEQEEQHLEVDSVQSSLSDTPVSIDANGEEATNISVEAVDNAAQSPVTPQLEDRTKVRSTAAQDAQHSPLAIRRSPRRNSSTPRKLSSILTSKETSHLIAFTPLRPARSQPWTTSSPDSIQQPASPIERAASAPPEEPDMSPRKSLRPRISDDTALLQAFLNRAAESKTSRRASVSRRESITNRRDSDSIRQALASPAKGEVLGEMNPNTPAPRKSHTAPDNTGFFDGIDLGSIPSPDRLQNEQDGPVTRRSDRTAQRGQPNMPLAPNKISIRGGVDYTVLKKTEAQELALLTRTNTRKNKGGAILPPLRLVKLSSQTSSAEEDTSAADIDDFQYGKPGRGRNVTWSETLVEFYQGGETTDSSLLSDELSAAPVEQSGRTESEAALTSAPPPAETPSKPRVRRLKPSRTAATPGRATPAPTAILAAETEKLSLSDSTAAKLPSKPTTSTTKRRSRIATPAKGLITSSLLPADLVAESQSKPTTVGGGDQRRPASSASTTTAKKISKLPAPASLPSSSLGQGKENLLSSPPKKQRAAPAGGVPSIKTFAPKFDLGGGKTKLALPEETFALVPGLMSPAKKGRGVRGAGMFGVAAAAPALDFGEREVPGLSSPAKKRSRRAG